MILTTQLKTVLVHIAFLPWQIKLSLEMKKVIISKHQCLPSGWIPHVFSPWLAVLVRICAQQQPGNRLLRGRSLSIPGEEKNKKSQTLACNDCNQTSVGKSPMSSFSLLYKAWRHDPPSTLLWISTLGNTFFFCFFFLPPNFAHQAVIKDGQTAHTPKKPLCMPWQSRAVQSQMRCAIIWEGNKGFQVHRLAGGLVFSDCVLKSKPCVCLGREAAALADPGSLITEEKGLMLRLYTASIAGQLHNQEAK